MWLPLKPVLGARISRYMYIYICMYVCMYVCKGCSQDLRPFCCKTMLFTLHKASVAYQQVESLTCWWQAELFDRNKNQLTYQNRKGEPGREMRRTKK